MGGLAARAYLQNNPNPKASALVTICTPHSGSYLAYLPEISTISEWKSRYKEKQWWVEQAADLYTTIKLKIKDKPVIKHLVPCANSRSDSLQILNNNIYKMPTNIPYVNVISQVPNQEILDLGIRLINNYLLDYEKCKQVSSPGLLAKGDGVVPAVSQSLIDVVNNTPTQQNKSWYEKVKNNIIINPEYEMQVYHEDGDKQTAILKKVLEEIIRSSAVNGKIVFTSGGGIKILDSDQKIESIDIKGVIRQPTWSDDGKKIAFSLLGRGFYNLHVINSDGGNPKMLSERAYDQVSFIGETIFISKYLPEDINRVTQIWKVDIASGKHFQLTFSKWGNENTNPVSARDNLYFLRRRYGGGESNYSIMHLDSSGNENKLLEFGPLYDISHLSIDNKDENLIYVSFFRATINYPREIWSYNLRSHENKKLHTLTYEDKGYHGYLIGLEFIDNGRLLYLSIPYNARNPVGNLMMLDKNFMNPRVVLENIGFFDWTSAR